MAQSTDNNIANKKWTKKDFSHKQFKNGAGLDSLHLSDAQKMQVRTINESFRQQMQDLHKQGSITVDQQKQKREALAKERKEKIAAILTPAQKQQFEASSKDSKNWRNDGMRANKIEDMKKDLNLSPDQSAKLNTLNSTFKTNLQNIRQNSALSSDEKKEQMKSLMKQHRSDMDALLTNDQKEQLKSRQKNRPNRTAVK